MSHRKTLAVVVGTYLSFFRSDALAGVIKQSKKLGYDVIILSVFTLTDEMTRHQLGEENIYQLLKNKNIDGYILVGYTIWAERVRHRVVDILRETGKGVVLLDDTDNYGFEGVICDDRKCFEQMTDHLIEHHGFKNIYCLTGLKQFKVSTLRLNGFFDSLRKHGIEITDDCYAYGDFWTMAATELAEKIASGAMKRPDAVICGNDKSAVTLVNELIPRGVDVPDDIAVMGYDFGEESVNCSPTVTTCMRSILYTGEKCVCKLHEHITGEQVETIDESSIEFIKGESCGCGRNTEFLRRFYDKKNTLESDQDVFRASSMQESLMGCENFKDLCDAIFTKFYLIRGLESYALCLNNSWNSFKENDGDFTREGYEDSMYEAIYYVKDVMMDTNRLFDPKSIVPADMLDDGPTVCYINPIHFEDRCFGYEVARFENDLTAPGEVYHSWSMSLSVALEYVRVQERMKLMYDRVFASSVRDAMTGLYNRKGYELYGHVAMRDAKEKNLPLLFAVVDMDGLKRINDTYGHTEGDNAITVLSQAIQTCCGNGEYCIRSGGDEFYIVGCYAYKPEITTYYRSRIDGYLSRYNENSGKPYKVGASVGFYLGYPESDEIDECLKTADAEMYAEKMRRKQAAGEDRSGS